MDYLLENLGGNRFQQLCQSLIVRKYPNVRCFPVNQSDGGRDATSFQVGGSSQSSLIVFQAKFIEPPLSKDAHKRVLALAKEEISKVKRLVDAGATEYVLVTNARGTAIPKKGSIDSLDQFLKKELSVPTTVWWRDDICRQLDGEPEIKWMFPDILTAQDVIKHVLEAGLSEEKERRVGAIRAFVRDQFEQEKTVKFKQVELENNLFDLFIDVPVNVAQRERRKRSNHAENILRFLSSEGGKQDGCREEDGVGAAALLLNYQFQKAVPTVVLEGAPGQGKSTITQYICQVLRTRILGEPLLGQELDFNAPLRLPIRIDLRDLATWISGFNPFSLEKELHQKAKSLESFLAFLIHHQSGGVEFSTNDLHSVLKLTPILCVLDGLDEVAGLAKRKEVIDEIVKGVNRISDVAISLQVIVTSRPAAFANAPGLPVDKYTYLELLALSPPHIKSYSEKWIRARHLKPADGATVRKILKEKLDQPHLVDLARNPMQLAILLSLIHTRGSSLPDKRTALYDQYMELFFNREAEKSEIVREYRDLLIDIHQYLGWVLHAGAENREGYGSISSEDLKSVVRKYLSSEGYDISLVERLFTGVVERVVALVSRVEGYYEFEVQPLREYFAARFLYATARYSPAGCEKAGTLPDRFDALARNPYWLNVTRFFSGCYSKGELPSLVDRIEELLVDQPYKYTSHPRVLAATLLSDWVFAQHPKSMNRVVRMMLHEVSLRRIASFGAPRRRSSPLVLPKKCGNEELVALAIEQLAKYPQVDYRSSLYELVRANTSQDERTELWLKVPHSERTIKWMEVALRLGVLSALPDEKLRMLVDYTKRDLPKRIGLLIRANRSKFVESDTELSVSAAEGLLSRDIVVGVGAGGSKSQLEAFAARLNPAFLAIAFRTREPFPLGQILKRYQWGRSVVRGNECFEENELGRRIKEYVRAYEKQLRAPASLWATSLKPWNAIVESGRVTFGDKWAFYSLANIAAGVMSREERSADRDEIFDERTPLCERARFARLKAGSASWWGATLERAKTASERCFASLLFLTWAGPSSFTKCAEIASRVMMGIDASDRRRVLDSLHEAVHVIGLREGKLSTEKLPPELAEGMIVAISIRWPSLTEKLREKYYGGGYRGSNKDIYALCQNAALSRLGRITCDSDAEQCLFEIADAYKKGVVPAYQAAYQYLFLLDKKLPYKWASRIVDEASSYPLDIVGLAEHVCRRKAEESSKAVGDVAEGEGWFAD